MHDGETPSRALRHPLWWSALVVLLLNDHLLKGSGLLPGWLTGKLSDVAGLVVAPVVVAALLQVVMKDHRKHAMWIALVAVGGWFACVNVVPAAARMTETALLAVGIPWRIWTDPTDLVTLPMLAASAWLMMHAPPRTRTGGAWLEHMLAMAGAVSCMATSVAAPPSTTNAPGMVVAQGHGPSPVFVIDPVSGRRIGAGQGGFAVVVDGVMYSLSGSTIVGTKIADQKEALRYSHDSGAFHGGLLTDGTRLFTIARMSGAKERLVAFDVRKRKVVWSMALPSEGRRSRANRPIVAGGLVIVPAGRELIAFDPGTGQRRWNHTAASALTWPSAEGRAVFVVDENGTIAAIDLEHGTSLWTYGVGSYDGFESYEGPPFGVGSGAVAFVRGDKLSAIDAATRVPRWTVKAEIESAVVGETVAVVRMEIDDDAHWVGIRMADGARLWKLNADSWPNIAPVVDDHNGLVLIRASGDELRAYTAEMGRLQWRFDLDDGRRAAELFGRAASGRVTL